MKIVILKVNESLEKQQKQSVNFQNYGKQHAYQQSEDEIEALEDEINELPIVEEFRSLSMKQMIYYN